MPKPGKTIKRSARAIERAAKNMSKRADEAQALIASGKYTADKFAEHAAGQALDVVGFLMGLVGAGSDTRPEVFITIAAPGGGGTVSGAQMIELDDPIAVSLVATTDLTSPAASIPRASVAVTPVPPAATEAEVFNVQVTVPKNQAKGLYGGFLTDGTTALGDIRVSIV